MAASDREERRRRIVERGSDRLALITGRLQTLQPSSSLPPQFQSPHSHIISSPPLFFQDSNLQSNLSDQTKVATEDEDHALGVKSKKHENDDESLAANAYDANRIYDESLTANAYDANPTFKPCGIQLNFFSLKDLSSCITAAENTRLLCSCIIALFVVLSHTDLSLLGSNIINSKSIIVSRPLCILLFTDVTIVIALLLLEKRRSSEKAEEEERMPRHVDGSNWVGAVQVLETGLVLSQIIRAVFVDCSIYAVIVICGLSLT